MSKHEGSLDRLNISSFQSLLLSVFKIDQRKKSCLPKFIYYIKATWRKNTILRCLMKTKKNFLWTTFYNAHKFQNCSFVKLIVNFLDSPCNLFNLWLLLDKYCVYQNMVLGKFNKEKEFSFLHIFIHKKKLLEIFGKSFIKALRKFDYVFWLCNKGFANQLTGFLFKKITN